MTNPQYDPAKRLRTAEGKVDWRAFHSQLRKTGPNGDVDDLIDAATEAVFTSEVDPAATPSLIEAVQRAQSALSRRSAALALGLVAPSGDHQAIDVLLEAYKNTTSNPFLSPSLLEALGLLAYRSAFARAQLLVLLLRLKPTDERYLLVKAAQVIGHLDAIQSEPDLQLKLHELMTAEDLAVQAEARQQIALISLRDALMAADHGELRTQLMAARVAFIRARHSEEHRPDSVMFIHLLDMVLTFMNSNHGQDEVRELELQLDLAMTGVTSNDQRGYFSDQAMQRAQRVLSVADALRQAASAVTEVDVWINFGAAIENLARLYAQVRGEPLTSPEQDRLSKSLGSLADSVFVTSLGPLLRRDVGQRRLARIRTEYMLNHNDQTILQGLSALERAAASLVADHADLEEEDFHKLAALAERIGQSPKVLVDELTDAARQNRVMQWAEQVGLTRSTHIERIDLYGDDPSVDEVVRPLLHQLYERLQGYAPQQWASLASILVSLVQFVQLVRDDMPPYVLCHEDSGLGQHASEDDLQEHLYSWLRQHYGQKVFYELAKTGGGRPDLAIEFPEARFPIEAKHEFSSIDREHVHTNFLAQPDIYASTTNSVCFLMVLDLRARNAAGHRTQASTARKGRKVESVASLYTLRDSFYLESLPPDPDVVTSHPNVVVVGLVPGNRPRPSSTSKYSKRPVSARSRLKTSARRQSDEKLE